MPYVVDRNPAKKGSSCRAAIPIVDEAHLRADRPDFILILPWNLKRRTDGRSSKRAVVGGRFVTAVPALDIV